MVSADLALTTIVAMIVVTIADGTIVKTGTLAMTATAATTVIRERTATIAMIVMQLGRSAAAGKNALLTLANGPNRHHAVRIMTIVAPGRLLPGGMMIGGLQGTMIDEERMMFGEALTLILTVAGMNVGVKKRTTASRREHRGRPMETTVGRAE